MVWLVCCSFCWLYWPHFVSWCFGTFHVFLPLVGLLTLFFCSYIIIDVVSIFRLHYFCFWWLFSCSIFVLLFPLFFPCFWNLLKELLSRPLWALSCIFPSPLDIILTTKFIPVTHAHPSSSYFVCVDIVCAHGIFLPNTRVIRSCAYVFADSYGASMGVLGFFCVIRGPKP